MSLQIEDRPRILFYVQHLLGTGHLKRAVMLIDAMRDLGLDVYLLNGGLETVDIPKDDRVVQLPPLRARDQQFTVLVDAAGDEIDTRWKENRRQILLGHFHRLSPDIVIIESFPFGRRQLRFEIIPLLEEIEKVNPQPLVLCSVRDIVQARPQKRLDETVNILRRYFDLIMVHSDPALVRFEESFPSITEIENQIHYTGYVSQPVHRRDAHTGRNEVIVSAGGGAVSELLLTTAIEAYHPSRHGDVKWRILIGPNTPSQVLRRLTAQSNDGMVIEQNRKDFPTLLCNCSVSVSQAGYNTVMDVLRTGVRAVIVPFEGYGETEQSLRAHKMQQRGIADVLIESMLSPQVLAEAIDRRALQPRPKPHLLNLNGAEGTAEFVMQTWQEHATARNA